MLSFNRISTWEPGFVAAIRRHYTGSRGAERDGLAQYFIELQEQYGFGVVLLRYVIAVQDYECDVQVPKFNKALLFGWLTDHPYSRFEFRYTDSDFKERRFLPTPEGGGFRADKR